MNSRVENGQMTLNSKEAIIAEVNQWLVEEEIAEIY